MSGSQATLTFDTSEFECATNEVFFCLDAEEIPTFSPRNEPPLSEAEAFSGGR